MSDPVPHIRCPLCERWFPRTEEAGYELNVPTVEPEFDYQVRAIVVRETAKTWLCKSCVETAYDTFYYSY